MTHKIDVIRVGIPGPPGPAVEGSDASAPRFALYVAASDASAAQQALADYVCDGTDDQVEIQAALDGLPAGGGDVVLSPGTFSISAEVTLPAAAALKGQGTLRLANGVNGTMLRLSGARAKLSGLTVDGNRLNQTGNHSLIVVEGANCLLRDVDVHDAYDKSVVVEQSAVRCRAESVTVRDSGNVDNCNAFTVKGSWSQVVGCHVYNLGNGHGIRVGRFTSDTAQNTVGVHVSGCVVENTVHVGITVELDSKDTVIQGCRTDGTDQAIKAQDCDGTVVDGCVFRNAPLSTALNMGHTSVVGTTFSNNLIESCGGGLLIGPESAVVGNRFVDCSGSGVSNQSASRVNVMVADNVFVRQAGRAVWVRGPGSVVEGNTADGCGTSDQVFIVGDDTHPGGFVLKGNIVRNNTGTDPEAFRVWGSRTVAIGNVLEGPAGVGLRIVTNSDYVAASGNVVADATTPLWDQSGVNSVVSGNVT